MTIEYASNRGSPVVVPTPHDPDSAQYYSFLYRPKQWTADTVKTEKTGVDDFGDIIIPTTPNGFFYICSSGGTTGALEPTFPTIKDATVEDGDVTWKAVPDDSYLRPGDIITNSIWTASATATLSNDAISADFSETYVKLSGVDSTISSIILLNEIDVLRSNGRTEKIHRSMKIKIKQR